MNFYFLIAAAVLLVLVIISLVTSMSNSSKLNEILSYSEDCDLAKAMKGYCERVEEICAEMSQKTDTAVIERIEDIEAKNLNCFSKMGVVNFDAFDDVKGSLSFAITLLNDNNDGFIITSLYGHNSCNTYLRKVKGGKTSVKLLDEEAQSLEKARKGVEDEQE